MKKFISFFIAFSAMLMFTACERNDNSSHNELLSDPFTESSITQYEESTNHPESLPEQIKVGEDENPTRALWNLLSHGGALTRFGNDEEPYEYNGSPITIPVTVTASDRNLTEWSVGVMCSINGIMQKLTSEDQIDKTIIVKENLSPGETITFEITFDPIISAEDANKEKIKIAFLDTYHPTFQATEEYLAFAGHMTAISTYGDLNMKARPTNIIDPITDSSYEERISTSEHSYLPSFYRGDPAKTENIISYLNINKDESLDFNVTASHLCEGTYYAFILQNNEMVTFNGGKEYMKIDVKEKCEYDLDFHLDKAECGDAVECVFCQRINFGDDYDIAYVVQTTGACLVVREDFII